MAKRPAAKRGPSLVRLRDGRRGSGQSGVKGERRAVQRGQVDHHGSGRLAEARNCHQQHLLSPGVCHAGRKGRTSFQTKAEKGESFHTKVEKGESFQTKVEKGESFHTKAEKGQSFHTKVWKGESFHTKVWKGESFYTKVWKGESFHTRVGKGERIISLFKNKNKK